MIWAAVVGAGLALTAIVVALRVPLGTASAPFLGQFRFKVSPGTLLAPAVAVAVLVLTRQGRLDRLGLRWLLVASYLGALAWVLALAMVDGGNGLARPIVLDDEYLHDVPAVGSDPAEFVRGFVENSPSYAAATRGHPPGLVLLLWSFMRLGVTRPALLGLLVAVIGAATVPLVLYSVRALCGKTATARLAPILVLAPYAVWTAVSLDAVVSTLDAALVAAGVLASSPARRGPAAAGWAIVSGLLIGIAALFSYTAPWMALSVICVYFVRRRATLNVVTGAAILVPVLLAQAAGFNWWDGLLAARQDFDLHVEPARPVLLWAAISVVVLLLACGPALVTSARRVRNTPGWPFLVGATTAVAVGLGAGFARGGVEHAWLPFFPWLLVAAVAPQRPGGPAPPPPLLLAGTGAVSAIVIEAVLATSW